MLTGPRWQESAGPMEAGMRTKATLSPLRSLTSAPAAQSLAPGTPPRAGTPAWSAHCLQGEAEQGEAPEAARPVPDPSWHPFTQRKHPSQDTQTPQIVPFYCSGPSSFLCPPAARV